MRNTRLQNVLGRFAWNLGRLALIASALYAGDAFAVACDAIFTNGAQSHSASGLIDAGYRASITGGSRDLDTPSLNMQPGNGQARCAGNPCRATGVPAAASSPAFQFGTGSDGDISVSSVEYHPAGDYGDVWIDRDDQLYFTEAGGTYFFEDFYVGEESIVYFEPGDYWIDGSFFLDNRAQLSPSSSGTVRIFVNGDVSFDFLSGASTFSSDNLLIYSTANISFIDNGVDINGFLYAAGNINTSYQSTVTGGLSGATVTLGQDSVINYSSAALASGDWGAFCGEPTPPPPSLTCASGESVASGLLGSYYDYTGQSFPSPTQPAGTPTGTRADGPITFDWGSGAPGVTGIGADQFAVRWDGMLNITESGNYRFETVSDDGVRLWVNDQLVIDNWTDHSAFVDSSASIPLTAGTAYPIRLEFYENGGTATIHLRWDPPSSGVAAIPAGASSASGAGLWHCPGPPPMPALLADYRMDESLWSGTAGEVLDASGNGRHGTAVGGATTSNVTPATPGDPGTCSYGEFDGVDDYVQVNGLSSILNATASLAFWIKTTQTGNDLAYSAPGVTGVEQAGGTDDIFWGWLDASGHIGISVGNDFTSKSSVPINNGAWRHVVLTRDTAAGAFKIYIDGSLDRTGSISGSIISNTFSSIGRIRDTAGTHEYFTGQLDEVRIYAGVLSDAHVVSVMNETHPCSDDFCPVGVPVGGLVGEYFNNTAVSGTPAGTRVDGPVNFNWGQNSPGVSGVNADQFSVRWEGSLRIVETGNYRFRTISDDGVRLWVDGVQIINNWTDHSSTADTSGNVQLTAGEVYPIRLEFYENFTDAEIRLQWRKPGGGNNYLAIPAGPTPTLGEGLYHCPNGIPDHYTIGVALTGITCQAVPVTITARDANGTAMAPAADTQITLSAVATPPVTPGSTSWAGGNTYIFSGSETSVIKALRQTEPTTLQLHVTDGVASEISSPAIEFSDTGLSFYGSASLGSIPTQVAGETDPNPVLRAVKTNSDTGACEPRVEGTQQVGFAFECLDPATCVSGQTFSINGGSAQPNPAGAAPLSYTQVELVFDTAGEASIPLEYSDVGRVRLHAQLSLPEQGDDPPKTLLGSSNDFVVKPYTLVPSVPGNPGATTGAGAGFMPAGEPFSVQVEARNKHGAPTPNFGREATPETNIAVDMANLLYPTGGNLGTFSGATTGYTPVSGMAGRFEASGFTWSEVGIITLLPSLADNDYLGEADLPVTTESGAVGRFYPFDYYLASSTTTDSCDYFTYMGEPGITLEYGLQARASNGSGGAGGPVVGNYDRDLGYVGLAQVSYVAENADNGSDLGSRVTAITNAPWDDGTMSVNDANAMFARQASTLPDGPFTQLQIGLELTDSLDARPLAELDMNAATSGDCTGSGTCTAKMLDSPLLLRYGRLHLVDGFGPETAPLPVTFITEHWNGADWISNSDSCTAIADTAIAYNGTPLSTSATIAIGSGTTQGTYPDYSGGMVRLQNGRALTSFTPPGAGNTGSFAMDVSLSAYPWLRFDWNMDGNFYDAALPTATFTFGSYRGHDRIIYWQEVLQ